MSGICFLDGKQVLFGDIHHAIYSLRRTFRKNEDYFYWEHPERYIEVKKVIYAYGGKPPLKDLFIEMEDEGLKSSYRSNVKKQKRLLTEKANRKYYDKQTQYIDEDGENKLFYFEKCCELLELYMKHITEDSIDRKDSKNNIEHYPKIYTENKLRLNKNAEFAFNRCLESWGLPNTMDDFVTDPYTHFLPLGDVVVDDLINTLKKVDRKQKRLQKKRKRREIKQQMDIDLQLRMQKYEEWEEEEKRQKNICNPISNLIVDPQSDLKTNHKIVQQNCKINKYNNFEEEEDFDAGF